MDTLTKTCIHQLTLKLDAVLGTCPEQWPADMDDERESILSAQLDVNNVCLCLMYVCVT